MCESLPAAGSFPHINETYDSQELPKNRGDLPPARYPGNPGYGSMPFPRAADFQAILGEIGYQTGALTQVPEATGDDTGNSCRG